MRPAILLVATPLLLGACGVAFTKGPPAGHEHMTSFECTESNTAPVLDIVFGALNLVASFVVVGNSEETYYTDVSDGTIIASGVIWAGISGVSAGIGFDRVKQCIAAKQALRERQARAPVAPAAGASSVGLTPVLAVLIMGGRDTLTVGAQTQLIAKAYDAAGAVLPGRSFAWSSSNDAIASVSNGGLVTTRATGSVVIAANCDNVVGTVHLVVQAPH